MYGAPPADQPAPGQPPVMAWMAWAPTWMHMPQNLMHGRARVKKEIYGYRYAVLLLVSGGSIQWEHPIGLIDHTTLSTSNTLPEMKCWEHVEPKLMAVPRPMSFSGIILAGKSELLILK